MKKFLIGGSLLVVLSAVALGAVIAVQGHLPQQPIDFNHRLHLERVQGIQCKDCHKFVDTQAFAGLPSKNICFECHDPIADEGDTEADALKPQFAGLMAYADSDGDIPWVRVTASHDDVFFSHRRHVKAGEIDCRSCHPKIPDRTSPPTRGPIEMSMETCMNCHEEANSSVDCISCHR